MIDRSLNYGRQHIAAFLKAASRLDVVVDLGAGHGTDLALAKMHNESASLHAVECWPPYVRELSSQGVQVHSLNIERDRLPLEDMSVDVVIANQVLEHTKELFWIFHEVSRVLRVGGSFVVGVPNLASLHNRILLAVGRQPSPIRSASAHVRGFTKSDLEDFVSTCFKAGYRVNGWGGGNFYPFPPILAKPLAHVFPSMAWGLFLMLEKVRAYDGEFIRFPVDMKLETNFFVGGSGAGERVGGRNS
jgi:SAM-dependent methyltransferase